MLKYLSSYTFLSLFDAITRNQSRTLCFFKYFFVKYFKYLRHKSQRHRSHKPQRQNIRMSHKPGQRLVERLWHSLRTPTPETSSNNVTCHNAMAPSHGTASCNFPGRPSPTVPTMTSCRSSDRQSSRKGPKQGRGGGGWEADGGCRTRRESASADAALHAILVPRTSLPVPLLLAPLCHILAPATHVFSSKCLAPVCAQPTGPRAHTRGCHSCSGLPSCKGSPRSKKGTRTSWVVSQARLPRTVRSP